MVDHGPNRIKGYDLAKRPKALVSKSSGIKPYLEKATTSFPNMMRRVTQTARDWKQKKKHSEMMKPYLVDPDFPYPGMDDLFPTPLSLEFPPADSDWTNVESFGEELWRFQCIIHCDHSIFKRPKDCIKPLKCRYGAWTAIDSGNPKGWKFYLKQSGEPDSDYVDITSSLNVDWERKEGFNGEIWAMPKSGSWATLLDSESGKVKAVYKDRGQPQGEYYDPQAKEWITIEAGRSICEDEEIVSCGQCPTDPLMTFDDASTPDTINKNSSISIYVQDGLPPYSWSVTGTGYSVTNASTSGVANTLNCVDGNCPGDYAAACTVSVTDACGENVSFVIRNADGPSWVQRENRTHNLEGVSCVPTSGSCAYAPNDYDYIVGTWKWNIAGFNNTRTKQITPPDDGVCPRYDVWSGGSYPPPSAVGGPMAAHPDGVKQVECAYYGTDVACCHAAEYTAYEWAC